MPLFRISEAAQLLGVSDDTVRRWVDGGKLASTHDASGRQAIDGSDLAAYAVDHADRAEAADSAGASVRNRLTGLVTRVVRDTVMAQVELQAGPYRIVSLLSREAADELDLQPGVLATASIKATNVGIDLARRS